MTSEKRTKPAISATWRRRRHRNSRGVRRRVDECSYMASAAPDGAGLRLSHESEHRVFAPRLAGKMANRGARGEPGQRVAMPAERQREEVKRVIAMRPDPRQSVERGDDRCPPAPAGRQARDGR